VNVDHDSSPYEEALDGPATRRLVLRLAADGCLDAAARDAALRIHHPARAWWGWGRRLLVGVGSALVLAGIVFFFAFNWQAIPPLAKLAMVQALVAVLAVAAWRVGLDSPVGQSLLVGASVTLGALLAVFGQIYQTGADAYELFVGWAALSVGWVVVSRSAAHWMLWVVVVDFAIGLYFAQVLGPRDAASWEACLFALAAFNLLVLAAKEIGAGAGSWRAVGWARWVLWTSALAFLTLPSAALLGDLSESALPSGLAALVALLAALGVGYWYFRYRARDLPSITLGTLSVCALVLTLIARAFEGGEEIALLSFGLIVLGVFGAAAVWLRAVGVAMRRERADV
jgi:uncharacterized membrane protein